MYITAQGFAPVEAVITEHSALAASAGDAARWFIVLTHPQIPWGRDAFERALKCLEGYASPEVSDQFLEVRSRNGLCLRIKGLNNITKYCYTDSIGTIPEDARTWIQKGPISMKTFSSGERQEQRDRFRDRERKPKSNEPICLELRCTSVFQKEEVLPNDIGQAVIESWTEGKKFFIMTRRFVFGNYIIEEQHKSSNTFEIMRDSDVARSRTEYRFIVEPTAGGEGAASAASASNVFSDVVFMMQCILGIDNPLSMKEMDDVRKDYVELVKTVMHPRMDTQRLLRDPFTPKPITFERKHLLPIEDAFGDPTIRSGYAVTEKADGERMLMFINAKGQAYFLNNTLDVIDLNLKMKDNSLYNSIIDGEFVAANKLTANKTVMLEKTPKTAKPKTANKALFAMFDIYFLSGKAVFHKRLMERMGAIEKEVLPKLSSGSISFIAKKHLAPEPGSDIFKECRRILDNASKYPYHIDGLIFTPTDLGVFAHYPSALDAAGPPKLKNLTWTKVIKWKPSDQNTIDFLVKTDNVIQIEPRTGSGSRYIELKLYIRFGMSQNAEIDVMEGLKLTYDEEYREQTLGDGGERMKFVARRFEPMVYHERNVDTCYLPVGQDGVGYTQDGERIEDSMIIEFEYDYDAEVRRTKVMPRRWIPKRLRDDKTRKFLSSMNRGPSAGPQEMPAQTANSMLGALSVWRSIHEPVTEENIKGAIDGIEKLIAEDEGEGDVYYRKSDRSRDEQVLTHMNNFHNLGVKQMLYKKSTDRGALLELACGKGSDMGRWRWPDGEGNETSSGPYRFVLGVDYSKDNIQNPTDGCYSRLLNGNRSPLFKKIKGAESTAMYSDAMTMPDFVFAVADCSKDIASGVASRSDLSSQQLIKFLFDNGSKKSIPMPIQTAFKKKQPKMMNLHGRADKGFDVVSCMFAIHYFCESEAKLNGFFENVARNLKPDGLFIATFMDGASVMKKLRNAASKETSTSPMVMIEGNLKDKNGIDNPQYRIWAIKARRDILGLGNGIELGTEIEVFVESINKLTPEYLVDYDTLKRVAGTHGLVESEGDGGSGTGMFEETLNDLKKTRQNGPLTNAISFLGQPQNGAILEFSKLNRWIVFKKNESTTAAAV